MTDDVQTDTEPLQAVSRTVREQDAPDYIPTITSSSIMRQAPPGSAESSRVHSSKQWGRIKNVAQIRSELAPDENGENTEPAELVERQKSVGVPEFQNVTKLLIKSKRAIRRVRSKYGSKATMLLTRQNTKHKVLKESFSSYNLVEMHNKMKHQRQIKLALIQKRFIDELPELARRTVRDRLEKKIEVLEKLKSSSYLKDVTLQRLPSSGADDVSHRPDMLRRRQSRLRKSIDHTNCPLEMFSDYIPKTGPITIADIDKELAIARSRERIEMDLNLPEDRGSRLEALRLNVELINNKYNTFVKGSKVDGDKAEACLSREDTPFYAPSRFVSHGMAINFFRKYARIVLIVSQWIAMIMNKQYDFEKELKSFVDIANDIEDHTVSTSMQEHGLSFDKKFFKANREISLSNEARKILTTSWQSRTPEMIKQVLNGLQSLRSLSEYPLLTQEKLCKVAWYQTIGPKKPIVRQGHHAESFYFILSGTAFVKKMVQDPVTGESKVQVAARLTKGHSFGEIGLLFDTLRTATVESSTPMELLVIGKEDFVRIFMKAENPDDEADHIKFLRKISFMRNWPIEVLKTEAGACLTHYFKRGSLITDNDRHSEWIYFVMSGTCLVLKRLKSVKPRKDIRPRSDPMSDIILPGLGMPNNTPKVDTGKCKNKKLTMDSEVFKDMTHFYDNIRRKYEVKTPQTPPTDEKEPPIKLPDQADTQHPKVFMRSSSERKCSYSEEKSPSRVRFVEDISKSENGIYQTEVKFPAATSENERRPVSRAKFNESTSLVQNTHFSFMWTGVVTPTNNATDDCQDDLVPQRGRLDATYRPLSRATDPGTCKPSSAASDVFVQVELLYPKDTFGLNTLKYVIDAEDEVFDVGHEDVPILSFVSRGAEVIMLSKKVFLKYADQKCRFRVREQIRVYPSENTMQNNMQLEADWSNYKGTMMNQYVKKKKTKSVDSAKRPPRPPLVVRPTTY